MNLRYDDYAPGRRVAGVIDLSMVENPFGPSPIATSRIRKNLKKINRYFPASIELLDAIAKSNRTSSENVILTDGADGALTLLFLALARKKRVLVPLPTFPRFHYYCALSGSTLASSRLGADFGIQEEKILASKPADVLALCSPNNPTGIPASASFIEEALVKFELVIVDEALLCFGSGASSLLKDHDNLVIARSFSKSLGLAGMRIGYALASRKMVAALNSFSSPFKVSILSQIAALETLNDKRYLSDSLEKISKELKRLKQIERVTTARESESLCYLAKLERADFRALEKSKVLITRGRHFDYLDNTYARISVGTAEQNSKLLSILS